MLTSAPVNRTTLHPQGVKPHVPHSQIEEVSFPLSIETKTRSRTHTDFRNCMTRQISTMTMSTSSTIPPLHPCMKTHSSTRAALQSPPPAHSQRRLATRPADRLKVALR